MTSWTTTLATSLRKSLYEAIKWGAILHCTLEYGVDIVTCTGPSMEPTIQSKDGILTERISPHYGHIPRNSIVVSKSPSNPKNLVCKRVIAIAGDEVVLPDGTTTKIPKGHVWVQGDNFQNSLDSRSYGPIPIGLIRGRAILRVWPLSGIGTLPVPDNY